MTHQPHIGECESCRARFSIPASFRADRARCRECGGVVLISGTQPVPRPALDRRRSAKPVAPRDERRATNAPAPATEAARSPTSAREPAVERTAGTAKPEKAREVEADAQPHAKPTKGGKKAAGVFVALMAAAKAAAVWRRKHGKDGDPASKKK